MELKLTKNHLTCKCEACGEDNEEAIEFKFDYNGKLVNLCNKCRDKLIKFLYENRDSNKTDKINAEFWVRFLCDFSLAKICKDEEDVISISLPIREDEQDRYREIYEKEALNEANR